MKEKKHGYIIEYQFSFPYMGETRLSPVENKGKFYKDLTSAKNAAEQMLENGWYEIIRIIPVQVPYETSFITLTKTT